MRDAVKLAAPPPSVDRVLERTGLKRLFEIHPDRESAIAAVSPAPA
jgi:anti-anti-sigma regulatory factor